MLVKKLDSCNRVFLEFTSEKRKYNSFMCYDCIYIDIDNMIYKINPKMVKSAMIDVGMPIIKETFIKILKCNNLYTKLKLPINAICVSNNKEQEMVKHTD